MKTMKRNDKVTRRTFFERSSKALVAATALAAAHHGEPKGAEAWNMSSIDLMPVQGKIALEEHFVIPETLKASYGAAGSAEFRFQLEDIGDRRIAEMEKGGIELCILSLVGPGIQAIPSIPQAIDIARRANDHLAEQIAKHSNRFRGFAALPMQHPEAAAKELNRCIRELKFCGALVNG